MQLPIVTPLQLVHAYVQLATGRVNGDVAAELHVRRYSDGVHRTPEGCVALWTCGPSTPSW